VPESPYRFAGITGLVVGLLACSLLATSRLQVSSAEPRKPDSESPRQGSAAVRMSGSVEPAEARLMGRKQFEKMKCASCHSTEKSGGCLGPPLAGISGRRSREFLLSRITDSADQREIFAHLYGNPELMPHPRVPAAAAQLLVAYLLSVPPPEGGFSVRAHEKLRRPASRSAAIRTTRTTRSESIKQGNRLYYSNGCAACHAIGNVGGTFAPRLDGIAARMSRDSISNHITGGELQVSAQSGRAPQFMMPPANLTDQEIGSITDFLMNLPKR